MFRFRFPSIYYQIELFLDDFPLQLVLALPLTDCLTPISMVSAHNPHSTPHTLHTIHVPCWCTECSQEFIRFAFFLLRLLRCAADFEGNVFDFVYVHLRRVRHVCVYACVRLADVNNTNTSNCFSNEHILIVEHLITTDSDQSKSSVLFNERWAI